MANGVVVYTGAVDELRAAARASSDLGMAIRCEVLSCLETWQSEHNPKDPDAMIVRRLVIDWPGFVVYVGVRNWRNTL